jgi:hypothetical protein
MGRPQENVVRKTYSLYIDGEWVGMQSGTCAAHALLLALWHQRYLRRWSLRARREPD